MNAPEGSLDRIGKWAVYGVAKGHQQGREGQSYAIPTIVKPGWKRSLPLREIQRNIDDFVSFAFYAPETRFLVTELGCKMAGYTPEEIAPLFRAASKLPNVWLPESFWRVLNG